MQRVGFVALALAVLLGLGVWYHQSRDPSAAPSPATPEPARRPGGGGGGTGVGGSAGAAPKSRGNGAVSCREEQRMELRLQAFVDAKDHVERRIKLTLTPLLVTGAEPQLWHVRSASSGGIHALIGRDGLIRATFRGPATTATEANELRAWIAPLQVVSGDLTREEWDVQGRYVAVFRSGKKSRKIYRELFPGVAEQEISKSDISFSGSLAQGLRVEAVEEVRVGGRAIRTGFEGKADSLPETMRAPLPACGRFQGLEQAQKALALRSLGWQELADRAEAKKQLLARSDGKTVADLMPLMRTGGDPDARNRAIAQLESLLELDPTQLAAVEAYVAQHGHEPGVLSAAAAAVGSQSDQGAQTLLAKWLERYRDDPKLLSTVIGAAHSAPVPSAELAAKLRALYEAHANPEARMEALLALGTVAKQAKAPDLRDETLAYLRGVLASSGADGRPLALEALGNAGDPGSRAMLEAEIWKGSPREMRRATEALRHVGEAEAVQAALLKVLREHKEEEARKGAFTALASQSLREETRAALIALYPSWKAGDGEGAIARSSTLRLLGRPSELRSKAVASAFLRWKAETPAEGPEAKVLEQIFANHGRLIEASAAAP